MHNKYPVFIVSKGRADRALTAKFFKQDGVAFRILVEPQDYDAYCDALGADCVVKLPFSNLGYGSMSARNHAWELAKSEGAKRHWVFDDNIYCIRRVLRGKKIRVDAKIALKIAEDFCDRYENIAIAGLNYRYFVVNGSSDKKPFYRNVHAYSAMLIDTELNFRWRLKYNEDVDLCLQALDKGYCTILFNAFVIDKVSTTAKMKGGNQTELYKNNSFDKKLLKTKSLEEVWPQYVDTVMRFNRPHHYVDWKKHFTHKLIRRSDINFDDFDKVNEYGMQLKTRTTL